jgi:hypothetical protein
MTLQLTLYGQSIAERFEIFERENPHVYRTLVRLAREWVERTGGRKIGTKALFEVARWQIALATNDKDFKLNNNYTAYYARLMMHREPELAGLFDLRHSFEADEWIASVA